MLKKKDKGNKNVKKILRGIVIILFVFIIGFCFGYLFDRIRGSGNQAGTRADVSVYDEASQRVERAANEIRNAAGNVREATGEIRIGINEAGSIASVARDIGRGNTNALDGLSGIENGIQHIMGILDDAEKRNAEMENACDNRMD